MFAPNHTRHYLCHARAILGRCNGGRQCKANHAITDLNSGLFRNYCEKEVIAQVYHLISLYHNQTNHPNYNLFMPLLHSFEGVIAGHNGNKQRAVECFETALKNALPETVGQIQFNYGRILSRFLGNWSAAKCMFEKAIQNKPNVFFYSFKYGVELSHKGEFEQACQMFENALRMKRHERCLYEYAKAIYFKNGQHGLESLKILNELNVCNDNGVKSLVKSLKTKILVEKRKCDQSLVMGVAQFQTNQSMNGNGVGSIETEEKNDESNDQNELSMDDEIEDDITITNEVSMDEFIRWWYDVIIVDRFKTKYYERLRKHGLNCIHQLQKLHDNKNILKEIIEMNTIHFKIFEKLLNTHITKEREFVDFMKYLPFPQTNGKKWKYYLNNLKKNCGIRTMESLWYHCNSVDDLRKAMNDVSPGFIDSRTIWEYASKAF